MNVKKQPSLPGFETEAELEAIRREEECRFQRICDRFVDEVIFCDVGTMVFDLLEADEDCESVFWEVSYPPAPDCPYKALSHLYDRFGDSAVESAIDDEPWGFNYDFPTDFGVDADAIIKLLRQYDVLCEDEDIQHCIEQVWDQVYREELRPEVYEYWAIDSWFASMLSERGCQIYKHGGTTIWGRETTGQAISIDGVVREIVRDLMDKGHADRFIED